MLCRVLDGYIIPSLFSIVMSDNFKSLTLFTVASVAARRNRLSTFTWIAGALLLGPLQLVATEKPDHALIGSHLPAGELNVVFAWDNFTLVAAFLAVGMVSYLIFTSHRLRRFQR